MSRRKVSRSLSRNRLSGRVHRLQGTTETAPAKKPESDVHSLTTEELPAPAANGELTLDEAIAETLQSDPKLRGAMEMIRQAQGDFTTSSLLPNPTVQVNGDFLPLRQFTPAQPGGPPELDVIATFSIDWWLFGKRAAAMANAQLGVSVSHADYCDQVRQRMANTASAFYDVLEAKAMLKLAQEDLASLTRRRANHAGRRPLRRRRNDRGRADSPLGARRPARRANPRGDAQDQPRPSSGPRSAAVSPRRNATWRAISTCPSRPLRSRWRKP